MSARRLGRRASSSSGGCASKSARNVQIFASTDLICYDRYDRYIIMIDICMKLLVWLLQRCFERYIISQNYPRSVLLAWNRHVRYSHLLSFLLRSRNGNECKIRTSLLFCHSMRFSVSETTLVRNRWKFLTCVFHYV